MMYMSYFYIQYSLINGFLGQTYSRLVIWHLFRKLKNYNFFSSYFMMRIFNYNSFNLKVIINPQVWV